MKELPKQLLKEISERTHGEKLKETPEIIPKELQEKFQMEDLEESAKLPEKIPMKLLDKFIHDISKGLQEGSPIKLFLEELALERLEKSPNAPPKETFG